MDATACRLLYLDAFTVPDPRRGTRSSDAIGYGITASTAIHNGLQKLGFQVHRPASQARSDERQPWILEMYGRVLHTLASSPPDVIFIFHIFSIFPTEIRRMVLDLGARTSLVGYTHGSHWDPTDTFRFEAYPGLELLDLANLDALDRVFLVSEYLRHTLESTIGAFHRAVAERLIAKTAVVGLPLDVEHIDACRTERHFPRTTIVFNHAPVSSKNPELFVRVLHRVLPRYDINVLFTRSFKADQAGGEAIAGLAERFPERVILGQDMALDDYYRALWMSDLQVSTASHESLGVSTLEAMYTENCCILPRVGSYPEICDNHSEILYDFGEEPLEERLCYFLEHPDERRAIATELKRLTDPYHPDVVVTRIANSILALLSRT